MVAGRAGGVMNGRASSRPSGFVSVTVAETSVGVVAVEDRDIGVDDVDGVSNVGEGGQIVRAADRRAVGIEIEHGRERSAARRPRACRS